MNEEELRALREKVKEAHEGCIEHTEKNLAGYGSATTAFWQGKREAYWNVLQWLDELQDARR